MVVSPRDGIDAASGAAVLLGRGGAGVRRARPDRLAGGSNSNRRQRRRFTRARALRRRPRGDAAARRRAVGRRGRRRVGTGDGAPLALRERPPSRALRVHGSVSRARSGSLPADSHDLRRLVPAGDLRDRPLPVGAPALASGARPRRAADQRGADGERRGVPQLDRRCRESALRLRRVRGRDVDLALSAIVARSGDTRLPGTRLRRHRGHGKSLRVRLSSSARSRSLSALSSPRSCTAAQARSARCSP